MTFEAVREETIKIAKLFHSPLDPQSGFRRLSDHVAGISRKPLEVDLVLGKQRSRKRRIQRIGREIGKHLALAESQFEEVCPSSASKLLQMLNEFFFGFGVRRTDATIYGIWRRN